MMGIKEVYAIFIKQTPIVPLIVFRIVFGLLMCFSQLRFIYNGWIEECYRSQVHFTYQYFDWIIPFNSSIMYMIVGGSALFALLISLGALYRISTILFFLSFTYLELIEKSWYLNHYYFVSLVAFLLIWIPAHRNFSIDALLIKRIRLLEVPVWTVLILKLQITVVYLFGGIAKLKSDWLFEAQPLKIWLKARTDTPIVGELFQYDITAYAFSWSGMLYDLSIPFFLWSRHFRPWAYIAVVFFHGLTYILFNIGMFPWLMIVASLIFISACEWKSMAKKLHLSSIKLFESSKRFITDKVVFPIVLLFFAFQFTFPLRHYILTDNVMWTENGFRFAWHVMVMEKNGFTEFTVVDHDRQKTLTIYPSEYLTTIQEKQMSFQPDMIWQFAQFLKAVFEEDGIKNISVYVTSRVSLNGRPSQPFIDAKIDLLSVKSIDRIYDHIIQLQ